ncbi:MAG TPA: NUDIX domain-containing protein [Nocardioides sp.]|uniref:NUDIX hydrolase n=1 Tax=Nocardioides sp. TaxID=35761 RepID=UPI002F3EBAFD
MLDRSSIRVKAMVYLPNAAGTHHAVLVGEDPDGGRRFHRLIGGGVELGERAVEAVVREVAEELHATLVEHRLLGVVENIFTYDGEQGHEVVFVYAGHLAEGDVVPPEGGWYDDVGVPMWVEWRPIAAPVDGDDDTLPLYPDGLGSLLPVR